MCVERSMRKERYHRTLHGFVALRGAGCVGGCRCLRTKGHEVEAGTNEFVTDALFSTITNANFDDEVSWLV